MATKNKYQNVFYYENTNISAGNDTAPLISLGGMQLRSLFLPENWTTSNISFNCSPDGQNFYSVKNLDGVPLSINSVSRGYLPLLPCLFDACAYIQIVGGVQTNNVIIGLGLMPLYQGIHN